MPVHLADQPLSSVAVGAGKAMENIDVLKRLLIPYRRIG
jgi:rod shape-determining protein MreB